MDQHDLDRLRQVYEAYAAGDAEPFYAAVALDCPVEICGPPELFCFCGPHHGPAGARAMIAQVASEYEWPAFGLRRLIAEGDRAVALTGGRIRHRASGVEMPFDVADVIRVADGKIAAFREYGDTAGLLAWGAGAPAPEADSPLAQRCVECADAEDTEDTAANLALVRQAYAAYANRDPRPFLDALADAAGFYTVARQDDFAYAGAHRGRAEIVQALGRIAAEYDLRRYEPRDFIADGAWIVCLADADYRHIPSSRPVSVEKVDIFRFEGGRIADFFEFFDTASVLRQQRA